ncbi:MAG: hypothetical protein NVS4B10_16200 [Myxococcales bacterium]
MGIAAVAAAAMGVGLARCGGGQREGAQTVVVAQPDGGSRGGDAGAGAPDAGRSPDGGPSGPPVPTLVVPSRADAQTFATPDTVLSASADEGGNLWAVSSANLYLLRPGHAAFEAYPNRAGEVGTARCTSGLCQNNGLLSVAGGGPGEAWVGYEGQFLNGNEQDDPSVDIGIRESGGAERFFALTTPSPAGGAPLPAGIQRDRNIGVLCPTQLNPDGTAPGPTPTDGHLVFCTPPGKLKNEPSGRWKMRSIFAIAYNHGPSGFRGDVFFGGNHGVGAWNSVLAQKDLSRARQEHQHAGWNYYHPEPGLADPNTLETGEHHGLSLDPATGNLWIGADFGAVRLHLMDGFTDSAPGTPGSPMIDFFAQNAAPGEGFPQPDPPGPRGFRTWGCTPGIPGCSNLAQDGHFPDSQPGFGGRDLIHGMTFDAYGYLWVASYTNGLARVPMASSIADPTAGPAGGPHLACEGACSAARTQGDIQFWNWNRGGQRPGWPRQTYDYVDTVAADPDGSLWVGTDRSGAYRFVAQTGQWVSYSGVVPGSGVYQITLDPRPLCSRNQGDVSCVQRRTVYFATEKGVTVYTGP